LTHDPTDEVLQISKHPGTDGVVVRCQSGIIQFQSTIEPAEPVHRRHGQRSTSIAYHPSGRHLAASSDDGTVSLLDADSLAVTKTYAWNVGPLRSVAFSADVTLGAAGSADGRIVVWDAEP
jgi:WD40 repeat protein